MFPGHTASLRGHIFDGSETISRLGHSNHMNNNFRRCYNIEACKIESNTWTREDMEFLLKLNTEKVNFISSRSHVLFCLLYK